MIKESPSRCYACGITVNPQHEEYCPRCQYPLKPDTEKAFLQSGLDILTRVARANGAMLTVGTLIQRYQARLNALRMPVGTAAIAPGAPAVAPPREAAIRPPVAAPVKAVSETVLPPARPPQPPAPPVPHRVFSWSTFFADQAINIVASLGAFLILVGALGFVATTSNLLLAFLIMFAVHAVFGITGFATYRFASFRVVATIYTIIYALLVPLVGFSAYRLIVGNYIMLSVPTLVAISGIYAAIVYTCMAIYQRFTPFAYLGLTALAVAGLATASALRLDYRWWPAMLMILALAALISLPRASGDERPFTGRLAILREPVHVFLYIYIALSTFGVFYATVYSLQLDSLGTPETGARLAILSTLLLIFVWSSLYFWLTRRARLLTGLAFVFLAVALAFCYTLDFEAIGYALALTVVAALYHGLSRFGGALLRPFGTFERDLDWIALALVMLVPLISSPLLLVVVLARGTGYNLSFTPDWRTWTELTALGVGILLTLSVAFKRAGLQRAPARPAWVWLFLLAWFLLVHAFSLVILSLNLAPNWSFFVLTLLAMAGAVLVRRITSAAWAGPLDVIGLSSIVATLLLSLNESPDVISALLLFFAVATYGILLYQRRQNWLFVPAIFALLALPTLRQETLLVAAILLPLAAIVARRFVSDRWTTPHIHLLTDIRLADVWEWPLLVTGLVYAVTLSLTDSFATTSTVQRWLGLPYPAALEVAAFAIAWYVSAALSRKQAWLVPALAFGIGALLFPSNAFWALVSLTPVLVVLAVGSNRIAGSIWAGPFYITALLGGIMTGYTGYTQDHLAATAWVLLAFALLAYAVGLIEDELAVVWAAPFFATWSVYTAAGSLGNLYFPPIVAVISVILGMSTRYVEPIPVISRMATFRHGRIAYALPLYATALAAALLTGVYGSLANISRPFYGAVPDALLLYALLAFGVLLYEGRPGWLWLAAGFAAWGTGLAAQLTPAYLPAIGAGAAALGLLAGFTLQPAQAKRPAPYQGIQKFAWSWPWYLTFLLAALLTGTRTALPVEQASASFIAYSLLGYSVAALLIMLLERQPELLVFPVGLAAWTIWIWSPPLSLAPQMIMYTLLCALVFATQFVWRVVRPTQSRLAPTSLHEWLGLGGQAIVVLAILAQNGFSADSGMLAQVGAGSLFALAAMVFAYGALRASNMARLLAGNGNEAARAARLWQAKVAQRWCYYTAGLLLSLVVSWELSAFHQTRLDVLLLAPASYLSIAAPFMMHDETIPGHHAAGQSFAVLGAALLFLPALWFSFSDSNLLPTLILIGESLALLALGTVTRIRVFILSSAGLLVMGTLRALFLSSPPSLALMLLGVILLAIATTLILVRRRLQVAWHQWE